MENWCVLITSEKRKCSLFPVYYVSPSAIFYGPLSVSVFIFCFQWVWACFIIPVFTAFVVFKCVSLFSLFLLFWILQVYFVISLLCIEKTCSNHSLAKCLLFWKTNQRKCCSWWYLQVWYTCELLTVMVIVNGNFSHMISFAGECVF